jgi:hypothetical protein
MGAARPNGQSALLHGGYETYARVGVEESARKLEKQTVDAASRQHVSSHLTSDSPVFSEAQCHRDAPATVITRPGTV